MPKIQRIAVTAVVLAALVLPTTANAVATPVNLGSAASFAVLGGSTVTNTGPTVVTGDLGVSPGTAVTGFPPGTVTGTTYTGTDAAQAQIDLTAAYVNAAAEASDAIISGDLGGLTLAPGVYSAASSIGLTGTLTLDAQGDPDAIWVFQVGSTLTTAAASTVALINDAQSCNVFWLIGTSATLGASSTFHGSMLAQASITIGSGVMVDGRALARDGAVTMDTDAITLSSCAAAPEPTPTLTLEPTLSHPGAHARTDARTDPRADARAHPRTHADADGRARARAVARTHADADGGAHSRNDRNSRGRTCRHLGRRRQTFGPAGRPDATAHRHGPARRSKTNRGPGHPHAARWNHDPGSRDDRSRQAHTNRGVGSRPPRIVPGAGNRTSGIRRSLRRSGAAQSAGGLLRGDPRHRVLDRGSEPRTGGAADERCHAMLAHRLDPFGLDPRRREHDRNARMQLAQTLDQALGTLWLTGHEGVVDEDVGAIGEIAGPSGNDGAVGADRAEALADVIAAASQRVDLLIGEIDIVVHDEHSGHFDTSGAIPQCRLPGRTTESVPPGPFKPGQAARLAAVSA